MRSFASADALGVLGWPGAQKKCFGLLGDCAAAAEVTNANSKATTRCKPEIHLSEWVRICDLPCRDEESGPPASTALRPTTGAFISRRYRAVRTRLCFDART